MSSDWIRVSDKLTECAVTGIAIPDAATQAPRASDAVDYPFPPKYGRLKTLAVIILIPCMVFLTPPGREMIHLIRNKPAVPGTVSSTPLSMASDTDGKPVIVINPPEQDKTRSKYQTSPVTRQNGEPAPKKKYEKRAPGADGKPSAPPTLTKPDEPVGNKAAPPAESEVDLQHYRNITGRL